MWPMVSNILLRQILQYNREIPNNFWKKRQPRVLLCCPDIIIEVAKDFRIAGLEFVFSFYVFFESNSWLIGFLFQVCLHIVRQAIWTHQRTETLERFLRSHFPYSRFYVFFCSISFLAWFTFGYLWFSYVKLTPYFFIICLQGHQNHTIVNELRIISALAFPILRYLSPITLLPLLFGLYFKIVAS